MLMTTINNFISTPLIITSATTMTQFIHLHFTGILHYWKNKEMFISSGPYRLKNIVIDKK